MIDETLHTLLNKVKQTEYFTIIVNSSIGYWTNWSHSQKSAVFTK